MKTDAIFVLVTCASRREARAIADALVREHLAACASVSGEVVSRYRWKGRAETAREYVLTVKTLASRWQAVAGRVRSLHSYEVPEIVAVPVAKCDKRYLQWICDSVE